MNSVTNWILHSGPVRDHKTCQLTASECCCNVKASISDTVARVIQYACHILCWLLFRLGGCGGKICDCLLEKIGVVTTACFEDEFARGCALFVCQCHIQHARLGYYTSSVMSVKLF